MPKYYHRGVLCCVSYGSLHNNLSMLKVAQGWCHNGVSFRSSLLLKFGDFLLAGSYWLSSTIVNRIMNTQNMNTRAFHGSWARPAGSVESGGFTNSRVETGRVGSDRARRVSNLTGRVQSPWSNPTREHKVKRYQVVIISLDGYSYGTYYISNVFIKS